MVDEVRRLLDDEDTERDRGQEAEERPVSITPPNHSA
jgi:hypothetical protein